METTPPPAAIGHPHAVAASGRRGLLALVLAGLYPTLCGAQPGPAHLAILCTSADKDIPAVAGFFQAILLTVGLAEGRDYVLEFFCSDGHNERFPALAQAAVARKPALIIVTTVASARAAQQATSTIPVVMTGVNDPVGAGLVASYARPGGNITGTCSMADDFVGKLVELTREAMPGTKRIAVVINPQNSSNAPIFQSFQRLTRSLGIAADPVEISAPEQVDGALAGAARRRPDALITGFDNSHAQYRVRIAQFAAMQGIAIIAGDFRYSDADALITYSAHRSWFRMPAVYIQKILGGAKPADLPVQQPTSFDLVVNTRVAQALKLTLPQSLLLRATQVIS